MKILLLSASMVLLLACASKTKPYECGPVMDSRKIAKSLGPMLQFMELRRGDTFADIGASSGALTVMMSTLMTNVSVYVEDIDTVCLNDKNLNKILSYYSRLSGNDLKTINEYHRTIGNVYHTGLPTRAFDRIYSNAAFHVFQSPDSLLRDLSGKLKPGGMLFIRDGFKGDHGAGNFCSDPACGRRLYTIEEFILIMNRNGYKIAKRSPDIGGYPVFGFVRG